MIVSCRHNTNALQLDECALTRRMALRLSWDAREVAEVVKITTFGQTQCYELGALVKCAAGMISSAAQPTRRCAAYVYAKSL